MSIDIKVPDIGDFDKVEIIEVLVQDGDTIEAEQALIVLESDKATMEVPSPQAGTLEAILVKVGDKVGMGDVIARLAAPDQQPDDAPEPDSTTPDGDGQAPEASPAPAPENHSPEPPPAPAERSAPSAPAQPPASPLPSGGTADKASVPPHASPSVRRFARELGVDLSRIEGSGPRARILKEDVQAYVKSTLAAPASGALPAQPQVDFSKFGEIESSPLPRIRKLSAANLHRNWLLVPHVTQFESADITELEAFRKSESARGDLKLTLLPFVIKAVCLAIQRYPEFASSLDADGQALILKKYCHIGFAADTPSGLVVPVIRDADRKSVSALARESAELAALARDGKLSPAQMQGGCFSISSLGGIGGSHFTPIVNAPEVAILGVSRARTEAVWDGQAFAPRLILPLSLSYDHRVIDGAAAARFAVLLAELLSDIRRLCL